MAKENKISERRALRAQTAPHELLPSAPVLHFAATRASASWGFDKSTQWLNVPAFSLRFCISNQPRWPQCCWPQATVPEARLADHPSQPLPFAWVDSQKSLTLGLSGGSMSLGVAFEEGSMSLGVIFEVPPFRVSSIYLLIVVWDGSARLFPLPSFHQGLETSATVSPIKCFFYKLSSSCCFITATEKGRRHWPN